MEMKNIYLVLIVSLLAACGGGNNAGDTYPASVPAAVSITGPNSFLTFPNPLLNASGVAETDSAAYATAYYAAIDPTNSKDTYAKWKAANGFGSGTGTEITVVVGDSRDLGYGRYITGRKNADGTMAFSVRNYLVPAAAGYGYSSVNLDAAVAQDNRWYIGASNIEFSPGPGCVTALPNAVANCTYFAKFYFFAPDGSRATAVNLDGRGAKAMPSPCITCHGGRGDPLTPTGLFPLVQNSASLTRGDVQGHMHPLEADSFQYSTQVGFRRVDQEALIKTLNTWVLQSYPLPVGTVTPTAFAEDAGRRVASANEWQGTAAASVIKDGYGGNGLPNATYVDAIPTAWSSVGQSSLYQNTVVPSCRVCHILRGVGATTGTDIDLISYAKFKGYADQIKFHTIDRGNMPLAKIHYEKFWATPSIHESMANFLQDPLGGNLPVASVRDSAGAVLRPGRPVADAGPSRTVVTGTTTLSGVASLYATAYQWSIVSGPVGGAILSNATARDATFMATSNGTYVVQLVVSAGAVTSSASQTTLVVNNVLAPAPSAIRFANIKPILQGGCMICHTSTNLATAALTPIVYNNIDRNGDAVIDATDDAWLYAEVRGRINFTDPADSPLLLKPSGKHHGGDPLGTTFQAGFDSSLVPGAAGRANYDLFLNWILNGAPQ